LLIIALVLVAFKNVLCIIHPAMPEWWQFFAPAKIAFPPSMAVRIGRRCAGCTSVVEDRTSGNDHAGFAEMK